jgi:glycosyltransferase involved in cell wall biosynthesis
MVVASDFMKSVLQYNNFEEERISVNSYFTSLPSQQPERKTKDDAVILAVGRMVPEKGIGFLLQSFAAIESRPTLVICGDGPHLKELKALASELGISTRVSFQGWVSHDQLHRFFSQCSLVVVPSVWPEPFGIVGIEAMAHGRPVIAFDVGGISEWLKNGETGFLVPRGDVLSLTQRIEFLLHHPKVAEEMGKTGRNYVMKRFLPEHHLDRLLSIFDRTIETFGTLRR